MENDTRCRACRTETLPVDERRAEFYMVTKELWTQFGAETGYLCIGCLEQRLGRELNAADFTDCEINDVNVADTDRYAWSYRTPRLTSRLKNAVPDPWFICNQWVVEPTGQCWMVHQQKFNSETEEVVPDTREWCALAANEAMARQIAEMLADNDS